MALQHLRSGTANKRPLPTAMSDGQLAVNTNLASPGLFFKDSNGDLVKAGPVHVGTTAPNASPASTAATALVANTIYKILTVGTSDFTSVGASANTVGVVFTASGTTTGTGTVSGEQGNEKGEQWLDTTNSLYVMKVYDGTGWRVTDSISLANGTAAAPSLHFGSDTNTGLFRSAADSLAITTAGTQRVTVDSSGNVGVGTSDPDDVGNFSKALDVSGASGASVLVRNNNSATNCGIFGYFGTSTYVMNRAAGPVLFYTSNTERMQINSSGNVGIGITSLTDRFEIQDTTQETTQLTVRSRANTGIASIGIVGAPNGGGSRALYLKYLHATDKFSLETTTGNGICLFKNSGGEHLNIDSSGKVGIGTSSPAEKLHITTSSNDDGILVKTTGSNSNALDFDANRSGADNAIGSIRGKWNGTTVGQIAFLSGSDTTNKDDGVITFGTESAASSGNVNASEKMRIDSSGNVGIGTTSPSHQLTVHNASTTGGTIEANRFSVRNNYGNVSGLGNGFVSPASNTLAFATNSTERMRIDSSGNVDIGSVVSSGYVSGALIQSGGKIASYVSNSTAGSDQRIYVYNGSTSTYTASINANGSATFASTVQVGGNPFPGTATGFAAYIDGSIALSSASASGTILFGYTTGSSTLTTVIKGNGTALFAGTVSAQGSVLTSDQRFKENITDAKSQLADVTALGNKLRNWDWTADAPVADKDTRFLGLVAQEAETICPGIVTTIARTKDGDELTPEVVVPAVYETKTVPAVLDDKGEVVEAETTEQVLVTEEQITPATYEQLDDSYKGIKNDILIMKLLGAVAELSAKVAALEAG